MAIRMTATYSKRLGLPGYSSHQFEVCVETEISSIDDIASESTRLYETLQQSVDQEIQQRGFVPDDNYGKNSESNGHTPQNGNGHSNGNGAWECSQKQRDLILKLIDEHNLEKIEIESLSKDRFNGKGVRQLNRLEASGLIDELFERVGEKPARSRRSRSGGPPAYTNGGAR